jgi:hypothetical protein
MADAKTNLRTFSGILFFYLLLSYIIFPVAFYYLFNQDLHSAGNGFVAGSILSLLLWYSYGRKLIE